MHKNIKQVIVLVSALLMNGFAFAQKNIPNNKNYTNKMEQHIEKNKTIVRNIYEHILNERKLGLTNTIIGTDYVGPRGEKGPEGFTATVSPLIEAFPDIKWIIEDIVAEDNKVVVRWAWTGTFKNPFRGITPTNKEITNTAIAIYYINQKKVTASWIQSDQLAFLMQTGVVSPSIIPGTKN